MNTLEKIKNTMKSFDGRIKRLENDPNVDLQDYCDRVSSLEHEFYNVVHNLLKNDEKEEKENVSSVELAKRFGLLNDES